MTSKSTIQTIEFIDIFQKLPISANFIRHTVEKAAKLVAPVKKKPVLVRPAFFECPKYFGNSIRPPLVTEEVAKRSVATD